ncbi:MAG: energy transducer TonB [Candidatus Omnitrophota bacterium]|jgi:TonB family protein
MENFSRTRFTGKKALYVLGLLVFLAPVAFGAENVAFNSSAREGGQKDLFNVIFRPNAELVSKPTTVFPENSGSETGTAMPFLIAMSEPILYPGWARRKGSEGLLVAALEILEDGSVGQWQIVQSTGEESLDKAATKAFQTWKFQPAIKNGKPVKTCIQVPINFELTKG